MLQKDYFGHFVHERSVGGKSEGIDVGISCGSPGERWKIRVVALKMLINGWI